MIRGSGWKTNCISKNMSEKSCVATFGLNSPLIASQNVLRKPVQPGVAPFCSEGIKNLNFTKLTNLLINKTPTIFAHVILPPCASPPPSGIRGGAKAATPCGWLRLTPWSTTSGPWVAEYLFRGGVGSLHTLNTLNTRCEFRCTVWCRVRFLLHPSGERGCSKHPYPSPEEGVPGLPTIPWRAVRPPTHSPIPPAPPSFPWIPGPRPPAQRPGGRGCDGAAVPRAGPTPPPWGAQRLSTETCNDPPPPSESGGGGLRPVSSGLPLFLQGGFTLVMS